MLLSCIGQRSLSNSGVLESLLNLLDSLLLPLQQPQAAAQARAEGTATISRTQVLKDTYKPNVCKCIALICVFSRSSGYPHDQLGCDVGFQIVGLCSEY